MKKSLLYIIFFCSVTCNLVKGQSSSPEKAKYFLSGKNFWELGISADWLDYQPSSYGYRSFKKAVLESTFLPGISARYYSGRKVFRIAVEYSEKTVEQNTAEKGLLSYFYKTGTVRMGGLSFGYQYMLQKKRFSPYLFSDLAFAYSEEKGKATQTGCFSFYRDRPYLIRTFSMAMSPGLGIRFNVYRLVVVSAEASLLYSLSIQKDTKNKEGPYTAIRAGANPFRLVLGFIF